MADGGSVGVLSSARRCLTRACSGGRLRYVLAGELYQRLVRCCVAGGLRPAAEAHFVRQPELPESRMQLDRSEVFGVLLALAAAGAAVVLALTQSPQPSATMLPALSAVPDTWPRVDALLLVELPDSGGYLANNRPIDPDSLGHTLEEIIKRRPYFPKGFFLRINPHRSVADLQRILGEAASVGWQVFDADKSGIPVYGRPTEIPRAH